MTTATVTDAPALDPAAHVHVAPAMPPTVDVLDRALDLHPQVSVRPESFGALLYHFGTRRLSFLKDRRLLAVVRLLPQHETARSACIAAGLTEAQLPTYARALGTLVATDMLVPRPAAPQTAQSGAHT